MLEVSWPPESLTGMPSPNAQETAAEWALLVESLAGTRSPKRVSMSVANVSTGHPSKYLEMVAP
jgi:hypothetical protein